MSADRRAALGLVLACSTWFAAATVPAVLAPPALLAAAVPLGFAAGGLTSALRGWPESIPPSRLAWAGARVAAVANLAPVVVDGGAVLVASRAAVGAALALVYPSVLLLAARGSQARPGAVLGSVIAALTIGSAGPHLIRAAGIVSWRTVLVATSVAVLAGGALIRAGGSDGAPRARGFRTSHVVVVLSRSALRRSMGAYLGHMWELYAGSALAAAQLQRSWGGPRAGALAAALVVAVGAVGAWAMGHAGDGIGLARGARLAMAASGSIALAMPMVPDDPWALTAALVLWGLFVIADGGLFPALTADRAGPDLAATALTFQLAAGFAVAAATSAAGPLLVDGIGWAPAFASLGLGPLLGSLALRRGPTPATCPLPTVTVVNL